MVSLCRHCNRDSGCHHCLTSAHQWFLHVDQRGDEPELLATSHCTAADGTEGANLHPECQHNSVGRLLVNDSLLQEFHTHGGSIWFLHHHCHDDDDDPALLLYAVQE